MTLDSIRTQCITMHAHSIVIVIRTITNLRVIIPELGFHLLDILLGMVDAVLHGFDLGQVVVVGGLAPGDHRHGCVVSGGGGLKLLRFI